MALIFNSITQFVQQPERTKRRVKQDDLDTLTEVFIGPSYLEDLVSPQVGAVHPEANLMKVINTSIKRLPASVSELTINYQGKLESSGSGQYTSVPTLSMSWMEGEVSFSTTTQTISRRYTGRCVTLSYITNQRPTGNPSNIGLSKHFLGFTNIWDTVSSFQSGPGTGGPTQQMACTDVKVDDKGDGWFQVTETYQSRMFPGPARSPDPAASISATTSNTLGDANFNAAEASAMRTQAAALAAQVGIPLPESGPGSVGEAVRNQTGIDPAWTDGAVWTIDVATNAATGEQTSTLASVSTPLNM